MIHELAIVPRKITVTTPKQVHIVHTKNNVRVEEHEAPFPVSFPSIHENIKSANGHINSMENLNNFLSNCAHPSYYCSKQTRAI